MIQKIMSMTMLIALLTCSLTVEAADDDPIYRHTFSLTGGLGWGFGGKNGFTDQHSATSIFFGNADYHYLVSGIFKTGMRYTYVGSHSGKDLIRCHFVGPSVQLVPAWDNERQAIIIGIAPGYLHYADRMHVDEKQQMTFNKDYFAVNFTLGYQHAVARHILLKAQVDWLTAKWKENDKYFDKSYDNEYYIDEYGHIQKYKDFHFMFKPSLSFLYVSVGVAYRL
jgi:hypothetical protein